MRRTIRRILHSSSQHFSLRFQFTLVVFTYVITIAKDWDKVAVADPPLKELIILFWLLGLVVAVFGWLLAYIAGEGKSLTRLASPPGAIAVNVLTFILPKKSYDQIFAQLIADSREEYFEALATGGHNKARWIKLRDGCNIFLTFCLYLSTSVVDRCMKIYVKISGM